MRCNICKQMKPLNDEGICEECEEKLKKKGKEARLTHDFHPSGNITKN